MRNSSFIKSVLRFWPFVVLLLGSSWIYAPALNHTLVDTTTLISQYESAGQPYSWLFRLCDILAALVIGSIVLFALKRRTIKKSLAVPLLIFAAGSALDGILTVSCHIQNGVCTVPTNTLAILHGAETIITAFSLFAAAVIHYVQTKRKSSLLFVAFQVSYGILELVTLLTHTIGHRAISQYLFQLSLLVWVVTVLRSYVPTPTTLRRVRTMIAVLVFFNGVGAVALSVFHLPVFRVFEGLYFASSTAWLAQHTLLIGIALVYLSRHIYRGEVNARRLVLVIFAVEVIKYSLLTPQPYLILAYCLSFSLLLVSRDSFDRHSVVARPRQRIIEALQTAAVMVLVFSITLGIAAYFDHIGRLPHRFDQYLDFAFRLRPTHRKNLLNGVLAVHLINTAIVAVPGLLLYSLFRPSIHVGGSNETEREEAKEILRELGLSSEDYFKIWPEDKSYFWNTKRTGFVAYKVVGGIAFALADPVTPENKKAALIREFTVYCRSRGWRSVFLLVGSPGIKRYAEQDYSQFQIGASAVIGIQQFVEKTSRDKWWRWQSNRSRKASLQHMVSVAPHSAALLHQCRDVSDSWLQRPGRREQGFALGYFDEDYLQQCRLHYLTSEEGRVVAFANELPIFNGQRTSVDLIRFTPDIDGAMPALLQGALQFWYDEKVFTEFDLGFVPLAEQDSTLVTLAKLLAGRRFAADGLSQFKNKFDPAWEPNFIAIDGDLADLAVAALNLERAMQPN